MIKMMKKKQSSAMWINRKQDDVCVSVKRNAEIIQMKGSNTTLLDTTYRTTKYSLLLYSFDKYLLSTHFLFRKSWNLNQVFHVF